MRYSVVFPAPFRPSRPVRCCGSILHETSSSKGGPRNPMDRFSIEINAMRMRWFTGRGGNEAVRSTRKRSAAETSIVGPALSAKLGIVSRGGVEAARRRNPAPSPASQHLALASPAPASLSAGFRLVSGPSPRSAPAGSPVSASPFSGSPGAQQELGETRRWQLYQRFWGACLIALLLVSWRLWMPQHDFPQVPLFGFLRPVPLWIDGMLVGLLVIGLGGTLRFGARGRWRTLSLLGVLVGLAGLVALDQHRLQAWAYQAMIIATLLLTVPPRVGLPWLRVLAVSVYAYSAAGKLDYQFLHTVGQQFLGAAGDWLGIAIETWQPSTRVRAALVFPLVEMGLGLAALFPATRRPAGWGLVGMHATLLWLLGPWGLEHQPGVLVWNGFFVGQALLLFVGLGAGPQEKAAGAGRIAASLPAQGALGETARGAPA